jgi:hypothetical protein
MKTVDLNIKFTNLEGKLIEESNAGKMIAGALAASNKGDALKQWSLAQRLYTGEPLELDPSDIQLLKDFVNSNEGFTNLAKAQILEVLSREPKAEGKKLAKA